MKRFNIFIILVCALLLPFLAVAADHYNAGEVNIYEDNDEVIYQWDVDMTADTTDNWYLKAVDIFGCNLEYGWVRAFTYDSTGTEDINIFPGYAVQPDFDTAFDDTLDVSDNDITYSSTCAELDAVGTTAKIDTLGINAGALTDFKFAHYLSFKCDGQTGNPKTRLVIETHFKKDRGAGAPKKLAATKNIKQ